MSSTRTVNNHNAAYTRQATILRKNLAEWDSVLHNPRGEDWPTMLGRLNAAFNQANNMDRSIDEVLEHFVYVPKQSPSQAQDIPFFLSTRLEAKEVFDEQVNKLEGDPVHLLAQYENMAAQLAQEYEEKMVRF
jgi:hypothetical protein